MNDHIVWTSIGLGWTVTVPLAVRHLHRRGPVAVAPLTWLVASVPWAVSAARGQGFAGHSPEITLLTAAHFIHAGFGVSSLLIAMERRRWLLPHHLGMVLVALGIDRWQQLEPIGAGMIVIALGAVAAGAAHRARSVDTARRLGLSVVAIGWWYPMVLALGWALARNGHAIVVRTLDEMIAQHGVVNALTVTIGLAAWPVPASGSRTLRAAGEEVRPRADAATSNA